MRNFCQGVTFMLLCLCSCSNPNNEELDFQHHSHITEVEDSVAWSNLVDTVTYIKLETNDKCRIGEVEQMLTENDKLYIVSNGIHCFDMEGQHLFSINQRGRAKNEYIEIRNINIIEDKLFLYDNKSAKMLIFDSNTGVYVDCMMLQREVAAAYGLKEKIIIDRKNLPPRLLKGEGRFILSPKTDVHDTSEGYFMGDEHRFVIGGTTSTFARGIIYSSYLNCTAWTITDEGCEKYLKLDIPSGMKLPESVINLSIKEKILPDDTGNSIYGLANIAESGDFITGRLSYTNNFAYFIYDKKSGNTICYSDVAKKEPWMFAPISFQCGDKESLFTIHDSDIIVLKRKMFGTGIKPIDKNLRNYEIFCSEKESDNPIVARFYLKSI